MSEEDKEQIELVRSMLVEMYYAGTRHAMKVSSCKTLAEVRKEADRYAMRLNKIGARYLGDPNFASWFEEESK